MKYIYLAIFIALAAATSLAQQVTQFKDEAEVPRMTVEEAKKAYDAGTAVIVDARTADNFEHEHIKRAINITNGSPASEYDKVPKGKTIIIYCS